MTDGLQDIELIHEIIIAYANGDFSKRIEISEEQNVQDCMTLGINMLGEELEHTTISRNFFESIYNAITDILMVIDIHGKITEANEAFQNITGIGKKKLLDVNYGFFIAKGNQKLNKIEDSINFETNFINSINGSFPIFCSISPIINKFKHHIGYLIIAKDITKRKNKEEQDLKLIVSTQEKERKRLAYDLHDSLGQELNALKMILSTLNSIGKSNDTYDETFDFCLTMLDNSINTTKKLAFDLMPKSLEDGNLNIALRELCKKLGSISNINYHFEKKAISLSTDIQVIIYRVFQEFISNSIKHANSTTINLLMKKNNDHLLFVLSDDGIGFNQNNVKNGNGIRNIKSRLEAIKASYEYSSEESNGTNLKFVINT